MRLFAAALLGGLFVATALSGCLGDVDAVFVPSAALPAGWTHATVNESRSAAGGNLEVVVNQYKFSGELLAEAFLVAVTDVPGVDEKAELTEIIAQQADSAGVALEETRTFSTRLDNGVSVDVTEYRIEKQQAGASVSGMAWIMGWETGDFQAGAFGWATTERQTLLGSEVDASRWNETQDVLRAAAW